ncbi:MAG: hypothetical protein ACE5JA_01530 [bacterium]
MGVAILDLNGRKKQIVVGGLKGMQGGWLKLLGYARPALPGHAEAPT